MSFVSVRVLPDSAVVLARLSVVAVRIVPGAVVVLTRVPVVFVRNGVLVVARASVVCTGWRGGGGSSPFPYESCLTAWW